MHFIFLAIIFIIVLYGPHLWVRHILNKHNKAQYFSGSGVDLARLLLDRMELSHVKVETTDLGDHYDPVEKVVRLSRAHGGRKSLTAVVVATHEVGHAVQDNTGYKPLQVRTRWIGSIKKAEKIGAGLLMIMPLITIVTRIPAAGALMFFAGLAVIGTPIIIHLLTLPVEWDASFKRALPILASGEYIPAQDVPAARQILMACALTYVANALASLLNVWRWIRTLRR